MTIFLEHHEYMDLLSSEEYDQYVLRRPGVEGVFVNAAAIARLGHYLPVNGDYAFGLRLAWKLNEAKKENGLVRVEVKTTV